MFVSKYKKFYFLLHDILEERKFLQQNMFIY
jgi:hypothetical protein